jgi:hypothetical protein
MKRRPQGKLLFSIDLVSDTHVNEKEDFSASPYPANQEANPRARFVFDRIRQSEGAFAVHMGDMINPVPELPTYGPAADNFWQLAADLGKPLHLVPGNHDIGDKPVEWMPAGMVDAHNITLYEKHFGEQFYSFDHEGLHFVVLNTSLINSGDPDEDRQRVWLEGDLEINSSKRTFFFIHYPIYVSDPAEPCSYDNIDEPGRDWLMSLIRRYQPEALFCAHVHNFWYDVIGETETYVMPSTCFVRQDYSEMYRIDSEEDFGRDDGAKLGHVTLEVYERGHVAHYHRTYGACLSEDTDEIAALAEPTVHVKNSDVTSLFLDMRHAWAEEMVVSPSGGVDEFTRKLARNDYPVLALWEMGIRGLRVPIQDLVDPRVRRRMELMHGVGHLFHVHVFGIPDPATTELLVEHSHLVSRLEIVINWDRREELLPAIADLKSSTNIEVFLSRVNRKDAAKHSGGRYNHLISHGFSVTEAEELEEFLKTPGADVISGFLFTILRDVEPWPTILTLNEFAERTSCKPVLYVKATSPSPATAFLDEEENWARMCEATLGAIGSRVDVVLDTLTDIDRGYFIRTGLVDRRYNPRASGEAMTDLMVDLIGHNWVLAGEDQAIVNEEGTVIEL